MTIDTNDENPTEVEEVNNEFEEMGESEDTLEEPISVEGGVDAPVEEEASIEEVPVEEVPTEVPTEKEEVIPEEVAQPEEEVPASDLPQQERQAEEALRNHYAQVVNEGDVFDDETAGALTNMAMKLHQTVLQTIDQQLSPRIMETMQVQQQSAQTEQQFYEEWPELQNKEANATVMRLAQAYRQANPNVDVARSIKEVGAAAMMTLGLSRGTPTKQVLTGTSRAGFKPAGVRSSKVVSAVPDNEFAELVDEVLGDM